MVANVRSTIHGLAISKSFVEMGQNGVTQTLTLYSNVSTVTPFRLRDPRGELALELFPLLSDSVLFLVERGGGETRTFAHAQGMWQFDVLIVRI